MEFKVGLFICLVACLHPVYSTSASFIKKCKIDDAKCIKSSAQAALPTFAAGLPEFGIETLSPLSIKHLDASSKDLKLILSDVVISKLNECEFKKAEFSDNNSKLNIVLLCTADAHAKYVMSGKILILPITGNGLVHVVLRKALITTTLDIKTVTGSDGPHFKIEKYTYGYELKDKASIQFDNLFDGNEVLGRAAKELIDSSPNEIVVELGPPIIKAIVDKVVKAVKTFFIKVLMSDLVV